MKKIYFILLITSLIIGATIGGFVTVKMQANKTIHQIVTLENMDQARQEFITMRDSIQDVMLDHGKYSCCLEKPCTYCIEKTPGHGEGAVCSCLEDIVNGKHPCGECIGEILEGHGNKFLAKYFAKAIAEEVGIEHIETLKQIIKEKYDITIEEQV